MALSGVEIGLTRQEMMEARYELGLLPKTNTSITGGDVQDAIDTTNDGGSSGSAAPQGDPEFVQNLEESITNPQLPAGTEVAPTAQTVGEGEMLEGQTLGEAPQVSVDPVAEQEVPDVATVDPYLTGGVDAIIGATGEVSEDAVAEAAQGGPAPQTTAGQISGAQQITPEQTANTGDVTAAQGTLSSAATAVAAEGQASQEFLDEITSITNNIDNFPFDPRSTVQEQYAQLLDFEVGEEPAWAKAAIRTSKQLLSRRGGAFLTSTQAGEAITFAVMQAALPIAQQDAQVFHDIQIKKFDAKQATGILVASHLANMDITNLNNRQQVNLQNAQSALQIDLFNLDNEQQTKIFNAQKAIEVAMQNTGFRQQAAIENARNNLTIDVTNLDVATRTAIENAKNSLVIMQQNLNNRQQANIENARNFFQMDMANLSNEQQAAIVSAQLGLQALLSDQAAVNAARSFNAQSENQVNQFFASLSQDILKFNSSQALGADQFNAAMSDARERFDVQNALIIEQANVQYLRDINTRNTADINKFAMFNAQNLLSVSNRDFAAKLTLLRDENMFNFQATENSAERALRLAIAELQAQTSIDINNANASSASGSLLGRLAGTLVGGIASGLADKIGSSGSSGDGG